MRFEVLTSRVIRQVHPLNLGPSTTLSPDLYPPTPPHPTPPPPHHHLVPLQAPVDNSGETACSPAVLYVGETDSIHRRLQQHRARHGANGLQVECLLVEVPSKSDALQLEEIVVRQLKAAGIGRVTNIANG